MYNVGIYAHHANETACSCWDHFFQRTPTSIVDGFMEMRTSDLFEFIFIENVAWFNFLVGIFFVQAQSHSGGGQSSKSAKG